MRLSGEVRRDERKYSKIETMYHMAKGKKERTKGGRARGDVAVLRSFLERNIYDSGLEDLARNLFQHMQPWKNAVIHTTGVYSCAVTGGGCGGRMSTGAAGTTKVPIGEEGFATIMVVRWQWQVGTM